MDREYLKRAEKTARTDASDVHDTVRGILDAIEAGGAKRRRSTTRPASTATTATSS